MRVSSHKALVRLALLLLASVILAAGCSRTRYRLQADREAYDVIAERNADPRWSAADYSIEMDPRSRYFDVYDPDCPPMPPDDPISHGYMQVVDGMKGWKHWYDNGYRSELENPTWRQALGEYVEIGEDGSVKLDIDSAVTLAYIHSPSNQSQLETLYLSALDVTAERFRLDTQYFAGHDVAYEHRGRLLGERNTVTVDTDAQLRRRFATAGDLLVGFANSFIVEFTGTDTNFASSIVNFSLIQPLLRGAGRDIALEQLTFSERTLLANLRAYSQYRQGFYTQVAVGELGVSGPRRGGFGTGLSVFSGGGGAGGYLGLLRQMQQIRNNKDNLSLQIRTLTQLEALLELDLIDLVQVDQFRQNVEREKSDLLVAQNSYELSLDFYKTSTIGLPPDLPIELDDSLIRQFQFVSREATAVHDAITVVQDRIGDLPDDADLETIRQIVGDALLLIEPIQLQLADVHADLARMDEAVPERERSMTYEEREEFRSDIQQLGATVVDLDRKLHESVGALEILRDALSEQTRGATARRLVVWVADLLRLVQRSNVVQARARLEAVTIDDLDLRPQNAFAIALENRLDFMNARAALVDSWRLIQVDANALQSVLNVTANGDIRTARDNALSFRAPAGTLRLGMEFDAPLTRLLERNNYRTSLIDYQRNRRSFIQSRDALHLGLRELLRQIEQLRMNLEIQRRAVVIAIRRVDMTRAQLYAPVPPPQPGQRAAQFGPTAVRNLRDAQSSLRLSQNTFLSVWISHYAARMRLARELGIMMLDQEGRWIESPLPGSGSDGSMDEDPLPPEEVPLPPEVPTEWIDLVDQLPNRSPVGGIREPVAVRTASRERIDAAAADRKLAGYKPIQFVTKTQLTDLIGGRQSSDGNCSTPTA